MKETTKAADQQNRYRGIIISIVIFLLLVLAILGMNLYSTQQVVRDEAKVDASAEMRDLVDSISRDLFNLKLNYGQNPKGPYITGMIKRIENNQSQLSHLINIFDKGGQITDLDGKPLDLPAVTFADERADIEKVKIDWAGFKPAITNYLKTAMDVSVDSTPLDLAVDQAQSSSIVLYNDLKTYSADVKRHAADRANLLQIIQLVGIAAVIAYFAVFIFYFMRKLRASDNEAIEARKEVDEIMETVSEGLFLVDKDLKIGTQYSEQLESIVGQKNIAGRKFEGLLESIASKKDLDTAKSFIGQLFNNKVKAKLIKDLNPLERVAVQVSDERGHFDARHLAFNFSRVYDKKDISKVLVSISDVTQEVLLEQRLEREQEQNDQQMEMLTSILHADESMLGSFLRNAHQRLNSINETLKRQTRKDADLKTKVSDIFREVHSLKGEASALDLESFVTLSDEFENKLNVLQGRSSLTGNDFLPLAVNLDELIDLTNRVDFLIERLGGLRGSASGQQSAEQFVDAGSEATENYVQGKALDNYFSDYVENVCKRNGKKATLQTTGLEKLATRTGLVDGLKDAAIQLVRNAVVHGVEEPNDRLQNGKDEAGLLRIDFTENSDNGHKEAVLVVEDDGKGIDYERIRQKAIDEGHFSAEEAANLSERQLIMLMFSTGFSTAQSVGEDAGRGVGLDVIRDRIRQMGGKIQIHSKVGERTRFIIRVPMVG